MRKLWTDIEVEHLRSLDGVAVAEAAKILGRSTQSVYHMRAKLARGDVMLIDAWSDDEDQFLCSTPHFTAAQQARHLNRAKTAVDKRREFLTKKHGVKFSGDADPMSVGSRRLLARTCLGCGLLLEAQWFGARKRGGGSQARSWNSRCTRCRDRHAPPIEQRDYSSSPDQKRRFHSRVQRLTRERATNHRQPWLAADHEVLRDSSLTVFEKAIKLGRTYSSAATACAENGYTSRVGKGDPLRGVWHISNPNAPVVTA